MEAEPAMTQPQAGHAITMQSLHDELNRIIDGIMALDTVVKELVISSYVAGGVVSNVGTWMQRVAQDWSYRNGVLHYRSVKIDDSPRFDPHEALVIYQGPNGWSQKMLDVDFRPRTTLRFSRIIPDPVAPVPTGNALATQSPTVVPVTDDYGDGILET